MPRLSRAGARWVPEALIVLAVLVPIASPVRAAAQRPRTVAPAAASPRAAAALPAPARGPAGTAAADSIPTADVLGVVTDSEVGGPVAGAQVLVLRAGQVIARASTDRLGAYRLHAIPAGTYTVEARLPGYRPGVRQVSVGASGGITEVSFQLVTATIELGAIEVGASPIVVDTRTGDQLFKQDEFQGSPTLTTSQIVQQAVAGAARAPTGEVHIRGQHAEYTYYVDGVPVPPGLSGSLNELFDPSIVNQISFQTGSWDAEYGGRNAAVINVTTRIPSGGFHASVSDYAGSFASNGQTLTASTNAGKLGLFAAFSRAETAMRREPVVADTDASGAVTGVRNYANYGLDAYGFGKAQYTPTDHDVVSLDVDWSGTHFQTPFDSTLGVIHDWQRDANGFVNLGWQHRTSHGPDRGTESFLAAYYRHGSLTYTPGAGDAPGFTFAPDTTLYTISEARSFDIYGLKLDHQLRLSEIIAFKAGLQLAFTSGHENFQAFDAAHVPGPTSDSPLDGSDVGGYAQAQIAPSDQWEIRAGVRYDAHHFPVSATSSSTVEQVSPRLRLSWFPSPSTTFWAYYGRQFIPTNVEDLRAITSASQGGVASTPTYPERDDFYEVGLTHRFPAGIVAKLSGYHKRSSPGTDDTQVPGTAITTDVNIAQVRVTGLEGVLEVRPAGPLTGFVNVALSHAYGYGAVTGGFFSTTPPAQAFDLDHDQRLSATAGLTYGAGGWLASVTGIYGSGLTNGLTPNDPGRPLYDSTLAATPPLGTGLFDFNRAFKVQPSVIVNASVGYTLLLGHVEVRPQLFVTNLLDARYLLKGTFFSGASVGRPRAFQVRVAMGV